MKGEMVGGMIPDTWERSRRSGQAASRKQAQEESVEQKGRQSGRHFEAGAGREEIHFVHGRGR